MPQRVNRYFSDIKKGDLILRESPLILMPKRIFDDDDPDYIEQWLDRRINRLTSEEREIFYSLADSRYKILEQYY